MKLINEQTKTAVLVRFDKLKYFLSPDQLKKSVVW